MQEGRRKKVEKGKTSKATVIGQEKTAIFRATIEHMFVCKRVDVQSLVSPARAWKHSFLKPWRTTDNTDGQPNIQPSPMLMDQLIAS